MDPAAQGFRLMRRFVLPLTVILAAGIFVLGVVLRGSQRAPVPEPPAELVLPPAVQVILYAGERYLAANVETVRATMSGGGLREDEARFRIRAHGVVSQLNPCHEDNYWIGNAEMTWGGAQDEGVALLRRAMDCRFWDEWPAFFYGFGQQFFNRNIDEARRGLETAAQRADEKNAAAYRKFSVMLAAGQYQDARIALEFVQRERDQAKDARLRDMLDKRVGRLSGLVTLRGAHKAFEARFGRPLSNPKELIETGVLVGFPKDPLNLGYTFENGEFQLRTLKNEALEKLR
jgi:hypothetical protein